MLIFPVVVKVLSETVPVKVVVPETALWFWVLVSTALILVSISKLLVKNETKTSWFAPNEVEPVPAQYHRI